MILSYLAYPQLTSSQGKGRRKESCRKHFCLIPAREPAGYSETMATNNLFKSLPHLLAAKGIYQRINHRIAHDEYEVHIEMRHKAGTVKILRARDHQNEMEEERSPAHNENAQ